MTIDYAMTQLALYAFAIPAVIGVSMAALAAWRAKRGKRCRRVSAWVIPLAGALGVVLAFTQPFRLTEYAEPGSLGKDWRPNNGGDHFASAMEWSNSLAGGAPSGDRWTWLLWALLGICLIWPILLMFWPKARQRRWFTAGWVALGLGILIGVPIGLTRYDDQPTTFLWIGPLAIVVLSALLYAPATEEPDGRSTADLLALSFAGLFALPVLWLTEWHTAAVLTGPLVAATLAATLVALFVRGENHADFRNGLAAGAMLLPIGLAAAATVAWFNLPENKMNPTYAAALILPIIAAVLGVWASRAPRTIAVVSATLVALAGVGLALSQTDLSAYFPERYLDGAGADAPASTDSSDEAGYWSGGG